MDSTNHPKFRSMRTCRGSILILVMVFLLLLTTLAVNLLSTAALQLKMSTNLQLREARLMTASATAQLIAQDVDYFDRDMPVESALCFGHENNAQCAGVLAVPAGVQETLPVGTALSLKVARQAPEVIWHAGHREWETVASSAAGERYGVFEVEAAVSADAAAAAGAVVNRGVALRLPPQS